jgi:hypothetical protein
MLQFMAVGNAPLMKRNKFTVNGGDPLSVVRAGPILRRRCEHMETE